MAAHTCDTSCEGLFLSRHGATGSLYATQQSVPDMPPSRIRFLRHAEEHGSPGVDSSGAGDPHSLTIRGWQRAGALARFLLPSGVDIPSTVFASKVGPGSETRRPQQTAGPVVALAGPGTSFVTDHLKADVEALMADVLRRRGEVIVVWEHSRLADCVAHLPGTTDTPNEWPADRYDLVWSMIPDGGEWSFLREEQRLLPGDG